MSQNDQHLKSCPFQRQNGTKSSCLDGFFFANGQKVHAKDCLGVLCPRCNTNLYLEHAKEDAESRAVRNQNGVLRTGENICLSAVRSAEKEKQGVTQNVLQNMGIVTPLVPDTDSMDGFRQLCYVYGSENDTETISASYAASSSNSNLEAKNKDL
jgi:hypothetical protein